MRYKMAKNTIGLKRPCVLFAIFFILSAFLCAKGVVFIPYFAAILVAIVGVISAFRSRSSAISFFCILLSFFLIYPALFLSFGNHSAEKKLFDTKEELISRAVVNSKTEMYDKTVLYVTLTDEKYSDTKAAVIYDSAFSPATFDVIEIEGFAFCFDDIKQAEFYTKGNPTKEKALSKGCFAGIYAKSIRNLGRLSKNDRSLLHNYYFYINDNLKSSFDNVGSVDTFSYALALLTGDRSYLPEKTNDIFIRSGLIAMLCISGLHIVISSEFVEFFLKKLRFPKILRTILLVIFLLLLIAITGGQGSVMRAAVMFIIFHLARLFDLHTDKISILSTSFIVLALKNPFCIFDTGTQLSFLSMTGIVFYGIAKSSSLEDRHKIYYKIKDSLSVSLQAHTFAAIPVLNMFGGISLISPFSNLFVMLFFSPLMFLLVICAFLSFLPQPVTSILAFLPRYLIALLEFCAKVFADIPFSYSQISLPDLAAYCFWGLFLIFLLSTAFLKNRAVAVMGLCCFIFNQAVVILLYLLSLICN